MIRRHGSRIQHLVNVSGGKDSTATYLLALESGRAFRAVFADTGSPHLLERVLLELAFPSRHVASLMAASLAGLFRRMPALVRFLSQGKRREQDHVVGIVIKLARPIAFGKVGLGFCSTGGSS
ncbi:hypothetical protein RMR16_025150 (plasmid) [Agrobacterium sp. rho-13.3]|uniref:hypothetical protein n=1 Tax=Agrobacterium sp. rho-13.3 TaxID=3072980 RepID=UPI002A14C931|nr:hypothetical protein [Agrobacterium sp. rho-13.3]MDX8310237.1 hypothetical protein [Agrobacterium sp. rho-13.3]